MISLRTSVFVLLACAVWLLGTGQCPAGVPNKELKLEARLVAGTNEDKAPNPKQKGVDPDLVKTLRKVFKWKNYFEDNRQTATIPVNGRKKITLNSETELEVVNLGGDRIEVKLSLCGKVATKSVNTLPEKEWLTLGGADKNNTAWFVVLRRSAE
ncbi:hypothetical protein LBMAG56_13670 [Verrucomicrobiota bacterium]|nr:hypothetical protein LBMAG56_13670 [Verrucomicrobiota bacterium]